MLPAASFFLFGGNIALTVAPPQPLVRQAASAAAQAAAQGVHSMAHTAAQDLHAAERTAAHGIHAAEHAAGQVVSAGQQVFIGVEGDAAHACRAWVQGAHEAAQVVAHGAQQAVHGVQQAAHGAEQAVHRMAHGAAEVAQEVRHAGAAAAGRMGDAAESVHAATQQGEHEATEAVARNAQALEEARERARQAADRLASLVSQLQPAAPGAQELVSTLRTGLQRCGAAFIAAMREATGQDGRHGGSISGGGTGSSMGFDSEGQAALKGAPLGLDGVLKHVQEEARAAWREEAA